MKIRRLGGIEVSEIGMGCMGFSHGYGQIPDVDYSIEAIVHAIEYDGSLLPAPHQSADPGGRGGRDDGILQSGRKALMEVREMLRC